MTIQERKIYRHAGIENTMTALTALKKLALAPSVYKVFLKWYRKYKLIQCYIFIYDLFRFWQTWKNYLG